MRLSIRELCIQSNCHTDAKVLQDALTIILRALRMSPHDNILEEEDMIQIVNVHNYLIQNYDGDEEFDKIYKRLSPCDISACPIFARYDRNRYLTRFDDTPSSKVQLLDKIHCHYYHSHHVGYRQFVNDDEKKQSQIPSTRLKQRCSATGLFEYHTSQSAMDKQGYYCYGYSFYYKKSEDSKQVGDIEVSKKYSSLSTEMLENPFIRLAMQQFRSEMSKAKIHYSTEYRKRKFKDMPLEYLLSIMIYCNYTSLQCEFTKTYRVGFNEKHVKLYLLHNNFYHLGKNLKMSVNKYGQQTTTKTFYHGVGEQLAFPVYVDKFVINSPLSTSSSFAVASNFTNNGQGLVITFSTVSLCDAKCFSTAWLSDFSNEKEYLFIRTSICIKGIIDPLHGYDYEMLLLCLKIIDNGVGGNHVINDLNSDAVFKLINHQLNQDQDLSIDTNYAQDMVNNYFMNKDEVIISSNAAYIWEPLHHYLIGNVPDVIKLFPNINQIAVKFLKTQKIEEFVSYLMEICAKDCVEKLRGCLNQPRYLANVEYSDNVNAINEGYNVQSEKYSILCGLENSQNCFFDMCTYQDEFVASCFVEKIDIRIYLIQRVPQWVVW